MTRIEVFACAAMIRLGCDECGRTTPPMGGEGDIRRAGPWAVRSAARYFAGEEGWRVAHSVREGASVIIDLCPTCAVAYSNTL